MTDGYVLLVEDNPNDEALTIRAFRKYNIANPIRVARDGAEALDQLLAGDDEPGPVLILLDLNLPKVSGQDVLRRLRSHPPTAFTPVVVLTSSQEDEDIIASYSGGANAYVRKPVTFSEFAEAMNALGVFWLLINKAPRTTAGCPV